jgi:heme exporter protein C
MMLLSLFLIFMWVPTEATMGIVQRIFYFHVPSAWLAFLAFFITFLGSVLLLWRGERKWDDLACSSAEIGVLFTSLTLISGPIWAKAVWGVWWVWDPRLTTTLVLWLIYLAYLLIRAYAPAPQAPRFAAVVGIIGFIDVPIVFMAIRWWRTLHPQPVIGGGGELAPEMKLTLIVSLIAFTLLYVCLLNLRLGLRRAEETLLALKGRLRR